MEVTRPTGGKLLCRRPGLPAAAAIVDDVPLADLRRGILEADKCGWSGSVAEFIDERRRFGGIVEWRERARATIKTTRLYYARANLQVY